MPAGPTRALVIADSGAEALKYRPPLVHGRCSSRGNACCRHGFAPATNAPDPRCSVAWKAALWARLSSCDEAGAGRQHRAALSLGHRRRLEELPRRVSLARTYLRRDGAVVRDKMLAIHRSRRQVWMMVGRLADRLVGRSLV